MRIVTILTILFLIMLILPTVAGASSWRKPATDIFQEDFVTTARRELTRSTSEIRAADYQSRYEACDEHHNCGKASVVSETEHFPFPRLIG